MVMLTEVNESVSACARGVGGEHAWERPEARGALSSVSLVAAAVPSFFFSLFPRVNTYRAACNFNDFSATPRMRVLHAILNRFCPRCYSCQAGTPGVDPRIQRLT